MQCRGFHQQSVMVASQLIRASDEEQKVQRTESKLTTLQRLRVWGLGLGFGVIGFGVWGLRFGACLA